MSQLGFSLLCSPWPWLVPACFNQNLPAFHTRTPEQLQLTSRTLRSPHGEAPASAVKPAFPALSCRICQSLIS